MKRSFVLTIRSFLSATVVLACLRIASAQGQAPPAPPGAQGGTEFGALRATGPGGAPARSAAITDVQATVIQQMELESYREIDAMTNAVNDLRIAAYSVTPDLEIIRSKLATLATAQWSWGQKTAELFSRVQASPMRLTPVAVDEHASAVATGVRRGGGGRRGGPTFTEPQLTAMVQLLQDSRVEAASMTNALIDFRKAIYAAPSNPVELRAAADRLSAAQLAWATKTSELMAKIQSSPQKLPPEAVAPLVSDTVSTLVPAVPPALPGGGAQ